MGSASGFVSAAGGANPKESAAAELAGAAGAADAVNENAEAAVEPGAGANGEGAKRGDCLGSEEVFFSSSSMASCTFF